MNLQPVSYEQTFITILRTLPAERVAQILDYARYIQSQTHADAEFLEEEETEEEILADEDRWEARFAASQAGLAKLAEKVRAGIRSGRTLPLTFTKDGGIAPG